MVEKVLVFTCTSSSSCIISCWSVMQVQVTYANDLLLTVKILKEVLMREKEGKSFDLTNTRDRYFLQNIVNITSHILGRW